MQFLFYLKCGTHLDAQVIYNAFCMSHNSIQNSFACTQLSSGQRGNRCNSNKQSQPCKKVLTSTMSHFMPLNIYGFLSPEPPCIRRQFGSLFLLFGLNTAHFQFHENKETLLQRLYSFPNVRIAMSSVQLKIIMEFSFLIQVRNFLRLWVLA